ncbi:hypothetical protein BTZ20_2238 [Rhodococcus sp. MTM3W5.2]|nr:hypothetical protein BTZ20_2238 [Rhodococcus sp. MTM3W5.2]
MSARTLSMRSVLAQSDFARPRMNNGLRLVLHLCRSGGWRAPGQGSPIACVNRL